MRFTPNVLHSWLTITLCPPRKNMMVNDLGAQSLQEKVSTTLLAVMVAFGLLSYLV